MVEGEELTFQEGRRASQKSQQMLQQWGNLVLITLNHFLKQNKL